MTSEARRSEDGAAVLFKRGRLVVFSGISLRLIDEQSRICGNNVFEHPLQRIRFCCGRVD